MDDKHVVVIALASGFVGAVIGFQLRSTSKNVRKADTLASLLSDVGKWYQVEGRTMDQDELMHEFGERLAFIGIAMEES